MGGAPVFSARGWRGGALGLDAGAVSGPPKSAAWVVLFLLGPHYLYPPEPLAQYFIVIFLLVARTILPTQTFRPGPILTRDRIGHQQFPFIVLRRARDTWRRVDCIVVNP